MDMDRGGLGVDRGWLVSLARVATLPSVSSLSIQLLYLNIIKYSTRPCHLIIRLCLAQFWMWCKG